MEEYRKKDDRGRSKAARLTKNDPHQKVDSSTWTPDAAENAGIKTGARPLVKRLFKKGGKVVGKVIGAEAMKRADRKPRKAGGRTLTADSLINRDVREANSEREGIKHTGAFKKGGKVHKFGGGMLGNNPVADQYQKNADAASHKKGGKVHRRAHHATYGTVEEALADNPMPRKEMETLNAKSPATEKAPPEEKPYKYTGPAPTTNPNTGYKKGGHVDEAADKALIKRMVKPEARTGRKHGGNVFAGDSKKKVPGVIGGRKARATGGRNDNQSMYDDPSYWNNSHYDAFTGWQGGNNAKSSTPTAPSRSAGASSAPRSSSANIQRSNLPPVKSQAGTTSLGVRDPQQQSEAKSISDLHNYIVQNNPYSGMGSEDPLSNSEINSRNRMMSQPPAPVSYNPYSEMGAEDPLSNSEMISRNRMMSQSPTPVSPEPQGFGALDRNLSDWWRQEQLDKDRRQQAMDQQGSDWKRGGRTMHAKGGRTKGTTVNIIMARGHDQQQNMPNAPVLPPKPPVGVPVPPPGMAGGAPQMMPQGMPPQMPPQGMPRKSGGRTGKFGGGAMGTGAPHPAMGMGMNGGQFQGNRPMPMGGGATPVPMGVGSSMGQNNSFGNQPVLPTGNVAKQVVPLKTGGRATYPIETGSGGGEARMDKIKAYGLKPPRGK